MANITKALILIFFEGFTRIWGTRLLDVTVSNLCDGIVLLQASATQREVASVTEDSGSVARDLESQQDELVHSAEDEMVRWWTSQEESDTPPETEEDEFTDDEDQVSDDKPYPRDLWEFMRLKEERPVKFFLYKPSEYEPRFEGSLKACERKGADYMFLQSLLDHKDRVYDPSDATVKIVPCLFESYRRCTTRNHAEKPPTMLTEIAAEHLQNSSAPKAALLAKRAKRKRRQPKNTELHPEDFEDIPWVKPFDYDTQTCLDKVQNSASYQASGGKDHVWIVADWAMNFGRTCESELFKSMTIGRIEVVDESAASVSNRPKAVEQSRCSFVVPYASDLAYEENWNSVPSFDDWMNRHTLVSFRFEDRQYVLFCKADPCPGAFDATPLRRHSLKLKELMGSEAMVEIARVPIDQFNSEMHHSKFCLVMRGDTPSSHSFYDALAANCVPIVISDKWEEVSGPYASGRHGVLSGGVDPKSYTLQFSEERWMSDLPGIVEEIRSVVSDAARVKTIFENMQKERPVLLWSHPGSIAVDFALQSAQSCVTS